jgi:hypothetical protein
VLPRHRPVQSLGRDFPCWASRTSADYFKENILPFTA